VSPTIIEERQLNIATMDVFSRLMMDRIIFLGAPIYPPFAQGEFPYIRFFRPPPEKALKQTKGLCKHHACKVQR